MIDSYGHPDDVTEINSYEDTVINAVKWAKARGIDEMEFNLGALQYNVSTERLEGAEAVVELVKVATKDDTDSEDVLPHLYDYIDSIVDACIFVLVDTCKKGWIPSELTQAKVDTMKLPHRQAVLDPVSPMWFYQNSPYLYYVCTCRELVTLGFSPDDCFTEAFKEISTRRGRYNKETNKWQKEPIPVDKEYKADYSICTFEPTDELVDVISVFNGFKSPSEDFEDTLRI